ncbi:Uncharacterised protein [uncultured archaeon]|nr:Uncharacterised protein [uncultured archaeon]
MIATSPETAVWNKCVSVVFVPFESSYVTLMVLFISSPGGRPALTLTVMLISMVLPLVRLGKNQVSFPVVGAGEELLKETLPE